MLDSIKAINDCSVNGNKKRDTILSCLLKWSHQDSNLGPSACKADALNQLSYKPDFLIAVQNQGFFRTKQAFGRIFQIFFQSIFHHTVYQRTKKSLKKSCFHSSLSKTPKFATLFYTQNLPMRRQISLLITLLFCFNTFVVSAEDFSRQFPVKMSKNN